MIIPYIIEPYSPWNKGQKKKHWTEIAEEESLMYRVLEQQAAAQQVQNALEPTPAAGAGGVPPYNYFHPASTAYLIYTPTSQLISWSSGPNGTVTTTNISLATFQAINPGTVKGIRIFRIINPIQSISGLNYYLNLDYLRIVDQQMTTLDISQNSNLKSLYCITNHEITSLNASGLANLSYIDCTYNNKLTSIDLSDDVSLVSNVSCHNNPILTELKINGCTALTYVGCYRTQITSLDISTNPLLTSLYCAENRFTATSIGQILTNLVSYGLISGSCFLRGASVENISGSALLDKETLVSRGWSMSVNVTGSVPVNNHIILNNSTNNTADANITNPSGDLSYADGWQYVSAINCPNITGLNVGSNFMTNINLSGSTAMTSIDVYYNHLTTLDVSTNIALTTLNCGENQLTGSLNVLANTLLTSLQCQTNYLTSLDVSANTLLTTLYCNNNNINQAGVDSILVAIDTNGQSGGTVNVSGNAAPGAAGLAAIASLEIKGWTVTTI